ncbi:hypothetical protein DKX38_017408 [Salix brachista]|uniref:Uncharacterized protein n=1 Tax=Salix brachista TaxID=2182728 RepID=A0A5N5KVB6_9ROSI|nr:hypothetical protein DKX38_017408 [Salix brachista]
MELLKLSKFKLQLQALATEVGGLREIEQSATEQCRILIQKQKQTDEEYRKQLQEFQSELASSNELRQKLQRKVSYLQNDNALLEEKNKDLKGTIQSLLQSKESFVNSYQELTWEMKRSIETGDRKLIVLSEKIHSHLSLFDSIEREALSIKQLVDKAQLLASEKEEVGISISVRVLLTSLQISVAGLRSKMDKVSAFENIFFERIRNLENRLQGDEDKFRRKDRIISELEEQLEVAKFLILYNQALHCEVGGLAIILQKIQETVVNMNEEDKRLFSSLLECQGDCDMVVTKEDIDRLSSSEKIKLRRKGKENTTVKRRSVPPCRDDRSDGHASAAPPLCLPSFTNPFFEGPSFFMPTTSLLFLTSFLIVDIVSSFYLL